MSTHNIPLQYYEETSILIILTLPPCVFPRDSKNEFETAVVDEPSVLEPLKFYVYCSQGILEGQDGAICTRRRATYYSAVVYWLQTSQAPSFVTLLPCYLTETFD